MSSSWRTGCDCAQCCLKTLMKIPHTPLTLFFVSFRVAIRIIWFCFRFLPSLAYHTWSLVAGAIALAIWYPKQMGFYSCHVQIEICLSADSRIPSYASWFVWWLDSGCASGRHTFSYLCISPGLPFQKECGWLTFSSSGTSSSCSRKLWKILIRSHGRKCWWVAQSADS